MNNHSIWSVLEESYDILGDYGYPAMDKAAEGLGLGSDFFTWVAAIWLFGAETFTTADYMRMFPYGLARMYEECFASAAQKGYLISYGNGKYTRSEKGLETAQKIWHASGDALADLRPISAEQEQRLFGYLARLIEASLATHEPPSHFNLSHKHENYRPHETKYPQSVFVIRVVELSAFRDDMYIAGWSAHGLQGHAWEVLDLLSQKDTLTFNDLHDKLSRRGVTREAHAEDVMELAQRGWVEEDSGKIQITSAGRQARVEVETETERLFFAPWSCLNESELEELASLAGELREGLRTNKK